jgi:trigger factor
MQVTETKSDGLKREYKVVLPAEDVEQRVGARLQEISKSVKWPGFRPGKVPLSLVKSRYGDTVMGEVLEHAVNESSAKVISEHQLRPAMRPKIEVDSFGEDKGLEYTMAVELMPEIEPVDFSKLSLERLTADVTDAEVDKVLQRIAEQHKRFTAAEEDRESKKGDLVVIDFVGRIGGTPFDGGSAQGFELELGSNRFVPGFEDQLVGVKAGEHVTVNTTFPEDYGAEDLAGKEASFDVDLKEIREPAPVAVDDALAGELGLENVAGLRKSVREQLAQEYASLSRAHLKRGLLDELAAAHDFTVPEGVLEAEVESLWRQLKHDHKGTGPSAEPEESDEKLREECRAIAERRVRLGLLLGEVGRLNNISVTSEEMAREVRAEAARYPGREREVAEFYQKDPQALANLRAPIFEDKVVDFILEMAMVGERKVPAEELYGSTEEAASGGGEETPATKENAGAKPKGAKPKK